MLKIVIYMNDYWDIFSKSGKVDDYLRFKGILEEERTNSNEPEQYYGVDNKGAESRRE